MKIAIGSDHAGYPLKGTIVTHLAAHGHMIQDVGSHDPMPVDFPDIAAALTRTLLDGTAERGIMVCGTGVGAAIAANKVPGIRAALLHDAHSARQAVEHDDVTVMCLGAQIVGPWLALDLIDIFLAARFSTDPDFRRRVSKLHALDKARR